MISREDIAQQLCLQLPDSKQMYAKIDLWRRQYSGEPPYLGADISDTLGLGYLASHEMARLVTLEFDSKLSENNPLYDIWAKIVSDAPRYTEFACALGGVIIKPYYNGEGIKINYVRADCFFPTAYNDDGEMVGCVFTEQLQKGRYTYTRTEYHRYEDGVYKISNRAFRSDNDLQLGGAVTLGAVPEWSGIEPETEIANVSRPLFVYFKMPGINTEDANNPLGESVFSKAMGMMQNADEQYSRLLWEAKATEPAVFADVTVLRPDDKKKGRFLSRMSNRLFKLLDTGDESKIQEYAPAIRDVSQINILNQIKRNVEELCGFAYGTFSDVSNVDKTATEIKISKQRSFTTVAAIQKQLAVTLDRLYEVLCELCELYGLPYSDDEIAYSFDDSLIVDAETERQIMFSEVSAGLISPVYYLMKRYGVTEDEALKMLPEVTDGVI